MQLSVFCCLSPEEFHNLDHQKNISFLLFILFVHALKSKIRKPFRVKKNYFVFIVYKYVGRWEIAGSCIKNFILDRLTTSTCNASLS